MVYRMAVLVLWGDRGPGLRREPADANRKEKKKQRKKTEITLFLNQSAQSMGLFPLSMSGVLCLNCCLEEMKWNPGYIHLIIHLDDSKPEGEVISEVFEGFLYRLQNRPMNRAHTDSDSASR